VNVGKPAAREKEAQGNDILELRVAASVAIRDNAFRDLPEEMETD
jgi:hypothetical protein